MRSAVQFDNHAFVKELESASRSEQQVLVVGITVVATLIKIL